MLSRSAENLYWMARYLERAENTARLINATTQASSAAKFGVTKGTKRYMRLVFTETGTFDGTFGALAVLSGARHAPVS
jgi:uncharacterized alpha-E superfamily protein